MIKAEELDHTREWDKTCEKNENVDHSKVTFGKYSIPFDKLEAFFTEYLKEGDLNDNVLFCRTLRQRRFEQRSFPGISVFDK